VRVLLLPYRRDVGLWIDARAAMGRRRASLCMARLDSGDTDSIMASGRGMESLVFGQALAA
jgi:hypothetical protein